MASTPEVRGNSVRTTWLLGGNGPKQSVTFSGGDPDERLKMVLAAKALAEAKDHCITRDEVYAALQARQDEPSRVPTLRQWLPIWVAMRHELGDIQPHVLRQYEVTLRARALPHLGHLRLTDIDRDTLRAWVGKLKKSTADYGRKNKRNGKPLSPTTVRKYYAYLSTCLGGAVPVWLPANPAVALPGERKNYIGLPGEGDFDGMFLEPWEADAILRNCPPALHDLVFLGLRTGMRIGELVALECRDVLFPRKGGATVLVRRTVKRDGTVGPPKTACSRRDITVSGEAAVMLARLVRGRKPSRRVFETIRRQAWNVASLRNNHWARAVGAAMRCPDHLPPLPVKPSRGLTRDYRPDEVSECECVGVLRRRPRIHDLRHTHASALLESGMSPKKVQLRLGHSSYQTTMKIYAHVLNNGGDEELDAVEKFLTAVDRTFELAA